MKKEKELLQKLPPLDRLHQVIVGKRKNYIEAIFLELPSPPQHLQCLILDKEQNSFYPILEYPSPHKKLWHVITDVKHVCFDILSFTLNYNTP